MGMTKILNTIKNSLREWYYVINGRNPSDIARECYKEFWDDLK